MMLAFKTASVLLMYPEERWISKTGEIRQRLVDTDRELLNHVQPLLEYFEIHALVTLQEHFVATFDQSPDCALYLFYHLYGDSAEAGRARSQLVDTYRRYGMDPTSEELPDFLPRYFEFLSQIDSRNSEEEIRRCKDVIDLLHDRLTRGGSTYAVLFSALSIAIKRMRGRAFRDLWTNH